MSNHPSKHTTYMDFYVLSVSLRSERCSMKVLFVDKNGTTGIIRNDLSVETEEPVSEEVHSFLAERKSSHDEQSVTVSMLAPGFLVELYLETPVREVKCVSTDTGDRE